MAPHMTLSRWPMAAALIGGAAMLVAADSPTGGEPGTYGFVLSNIYMLNGGEADSCSMTADGDLDRYYRMLPAAEQARFATPDKRQALEKQMNEHFGFRRLSLRGAQADTIKMPPGLTPKSELTPEQAMEVASLNGFPKGRGRLAFQKTNIVYSACSNPTDFAVLGEGFREYDGPVAAGIDLDGKAGREDYPGPDGKRNVDNQLWRAAGCVKPFRESSNPELARKTFMSARAPTLIQLKGVDDLRNDPDVEVTVMAATDQIVRDARGGALARATFAVDPDPVLRKTMRGRIVDGVLETEPSDLVLAYKEQIIDAPRHIRSARIRAKLQGDGAIEGSIFGYYTLASYYDSIEQMTQNGANTTGVSCPGMFQAIHRLADGYPDPRTGRNTAISSAYGFFGVRAFVAPPSGGDQ